MKWLFSDTSTKEPKAQFRTKRAAIEYGKRNGKRHLYRVER
jgi:hypothetical protein